MANFFTEIERCRRLGVAFDLLRDLDGLQLDGYREVVRVREDGRVQIEEAGRVHLHDGPRVPERSDGQPPQLEVELALPNGSASRVVTARARITEGAAPVYYTVGADAAGVYHNAMVLWELDGPAEEDYRTLTGRVVDRESGDAGRAFIEAQVRVETPGRYRLRAATTDLVGRSSVVWKEFAIP